MATERQKRNREIRYKKAYQDLLEDIRRRTFVSFHLTCFLLRLMGVFSENYRMKPVLENPEKNLATEIIIFDRW